MHERIDPRRIIETVKNEEEVSPQISLFEEQKKPLREAIEFYKHKENWSNRLIAGDSLLVMNSLLEKIVCYIGIRFSLWKKRGWRNGFIVGFDLKK